MRYCLLLLSAVLVIIASCKKVEVPQSKEDILRASKWQMKEIQKKTRLDDTTFYIDTVKVEGMAECKHDDYLEFRENNAGFFKSGEKKCIGMVEETAIRWGITTNDTKMYIYEAGEMFEGHNEINANLYEFTNDQFVIQYTGITEGLIGTPPNAYYKKDTTWYTAIVRRF